MKQLNKATIAYKFQKSKLKISKHYIYNIEPTKLTQRIEEITNYKIRKQNLADDIKRIEFRSLLYSDVKGHPGKN